MKLRKAIIMLAATASIIPVQIQAESVSRKEAQQVASKFFNEAAGRTMAQPKFVYNGKRLSTDRLFTPFYIFNNPAGGFVIIAADNKALPILGYSLTESFSPDAMGSAQKALLADYSRQIEYIRLDSQIPEAAISAWGDIDGYIKNVLDSRFISTNALINPEKSKNEVQALARSYDAENYSSAIYTPSQWQQIVENELRDQGYVALGFPNAKGFPAATVYGTKGDYFRIDLDGTNDAFYRLNATEIIPASQLAMTGYPFVEDETEYEEEPFTFYDSFLSEQQQEARRREKILENRLSPTEPQIHFIGSGHYDILFPEDIIMARVYSLSGSQVETFTYRPTGHVHIDISDQPKGFYFVLANSTDGRPYGIKIVR